MPWKDLDLERGLWYVAGEQLKNGSPLVVVRDDIEYSIYKARHLGEALESEMEVR